MLSNLKNYYIYSELVQNGTITVPTNCITATTWKNHYNGILNIMKDGIETREVQHMKIVVQFVEDNESVTFYIPDYYLNLIMWYPLVNINKTIRPQHIFFNDEGTTGDSIKKYIDKYFIMPNKLTLSNKTLNNAIADTLFNFSDVDDFSLYLANTLNLEDDIDLMEKSKEYNDFIHCDLSSYPVDQIKDIGLDITNNAIDNYIMKSKKILGYEHCLKNAFAADEGINRRQYKEANFNIGTKPDGLGSIYHDIINQSYITGGLNNLLYLLIDSGASRVAQIISKNNVGDSGGFSRILGLNNMNAFLNPDPTYDCMTKNFEEITITNDKILGMLVDRYYRLRPEGIEYKIHADDTFLIGRKIYLRSPMTCASFAHGHGICYKCYGDLAYTNCDINIGRIAAEIITAQYTQMRLSAKHLLETFINKICWVALFHKYFKIDINLISLNPDLFETGQDMNNFSIRIKMEDIQAEDDEKFFDHKYMNTDSQDMQDSGPFYNEYLTNFYVVTPDDEEIPIYTINEEDGSPADNHIYISNEFSGKIRKMINEKADYNDILEDEVDYIDIPFSYVRDSVLFLLKLENNDLGKSLDVFTDLINKKPVTKQYDRNEILQHLMDVVLKGRVKSMAVHLEVIMANQLRDANDRLKMPDWSVKDAPYELLTLHEALTDNPSVVVSFMYQKLAKALFYPLSYQKTAPSIYDLFFIRKPKKYLNVDHEIYSELNKPKIQKGECPVVFVHDRTAPKPKSTKELLEKFGKIKKTELDD